ncbi:hypothetical protein TanjilG_05428 [Lupinus angustifolius]|uniref:Complex 1 LYR protein domain-containing protein n=1 Tax=Lupinus angustifolius TaxID=3871 RepID=A0A1J7HPR6_LUPAN|nr:PREDICTED: uncharacterized protein LOC109343978 [Lupinus angustifolius]OIW14807.1 hypothetical protein TanjilG_05428 [Lupinus angustifolius]
MALRIRFKSIAAKRVYFQQRHLHEGPDTIDELLERHLEKKDKKVNSLDEDEQELLNRRKLTSTRREALSLYRDIIRASRFFTWPDSNGVLWRDLLRENARREFEEARFETDPEIVTRLVIGGREALESTIDKVVEKQKEQLQKERGGGGQR